MKLMKRRCGAQIVYLVIGKDGCHYFGSSSQSVIKLALSEKK